MRWGLIRQPRYELAGIQVVHELSARHEPDGKKSEKYKEFYDLSRYSAHFLAQMGQAIHKLDY